MKTSTLLLASALVCSVLAGCKCETKTNDRFPKFELPGAGGSGERTSLDFGQVQVNVKSVRKIMLRNGGNISLTVAKATTAAPFGVDTMLPLEIAVGTSAELLVTFTPTEPDQRVTGMLTFTSNDPARETASIALAGQGVTAVARVTPNPIDFGDVYIGESKKVMVTMNNAGSDDLVVQGATFNAATPMTVSGDLSKFKVSLGAGTSVTTELTFSPTAAELLTGMAALELNLDPMQGGKITVPIKGRSTLALPKLCFKRDGTGTEVCADISNTSPSILAGAFCDNRLFNCGVDGGFTGKIYVKNEGNFPVAYALNWKALPYPSARCDGGSVGSDFTFSNAPLLADGGRQANFTEATVKLPNSLNDPKPWETAAVTVTYRASSVCRDDAADQAQIFWTRQAQNDAGEPAGSNRMPGTLFMTLQASSRLPHADPSNWSCGTAGSPATLPCEAPFYGVNNGGDAPLKVTKVELWQEFDRSFGDGGGPNGGIFQICDALNPAGDCAAFSWKNVDGGNPNQYAPHSVAATSNPMNPTQVQLGRLAFGEACLDGGLTSCSNTSFKLFAVITTDDPYSPTVITKISGYGQ